MGTDRGNAIAIIGMAGRFPGARDLDRFWRNLRDGIESIETPSREDLIAAGVDPAIIDHPSYIRAAATMEGADLFDAAFFDMAPRQAVITDPQHRVFLETAWSALEAAGYTPSTFDGVIGCFASAALNTYLLYNLLGNVDATNMTSMLPIFLGNDKDFLAPQVAYRLGLEGPALNVQTACSSGLVAVHLAVQSLLNGECDMALAGAVSIRPPERVGYIYEEGMILSADGRVRAFDARATGTVFGHGIGIVVLRRLDDAVASRDRVRAVVLGTAVGNDGARRSTFHAPSVDGQARVIAEAHGVAEIEPEQVGYVECHGTGTPIGDPIEVEALTRVFRERTRAIQSCGIGSVKTNVGHLEVAAGMVSLIKTVLAMENGQIPPSLNFEIPNPAIDFQGSPFFVNTRLRPWPKDRPYAGVSSFGMGGTNAHVVLDRAPEASNSSATRRLYLLPLSAKDGDGLRALAESHASAPPKDLASTAFTAGAGRDHFAQRMAIVAAGAPDVVDSLRAHLDGKRTPNVVDGRREDSSPLEVAFLFTGQGSQWAGMGRALYEAEPAFRDAFDRVARTFDVHRDVPLASAVFGGPALEGQLGETGTTQPALFALEWALVELWRQWGIEPSAVLGHSVGELVAAAASGWLEVEDAARLVSLRARLTQSLPDGGGMMSVLAPWIEIEPLIGAFDLDVAAINGPENIVLSGPKTALRSANAELVRSGFETRDLDVSHAFHSRLIDPILDELEAAARSVPHHPPRIPLISCVTGRLADAVDGRHWRNHARRPVLFRRAMETLLELGPLALVEIGPHPILLSLARDLSSDRGTVPSLRKGADDERQMLEGLARLYVRGARVDWRGVFRHEPCSRAVLPTYPFTSRRYWMEPRRAPTTPSQTSSLPLYEIRWTTAASPEPSAGPVFILGEAPPLATMREAVRLPWEATDRELTSIPSTAHVVFSPPRAHLARALAELSALATRAATHVAATDWVLLTSGAQPVAGDEIEPTGRSLWGFGGVLQQELPNVSLRLIDVSDGAASDVLLREILGGTEPRVSIRWSDRHVARLHPMDAPRSIPTLRQDGIYVVTGGTGGIGRAVAHWLKDRGAGRVVVISRSSSGHAQSGLEHRVCDVSDREAVERLFEDLQRVGPIRGIFHAAGVFEIGTLGAANEEHFRRVLAPKVAGTENLDRASRSSDLDHFVVFSSMASVLAVPGSGAYSAANAYADAVVAARIRAGFSGSSINWGAWAIGGMSKSFPDSSKMLEAYGLTAIDRDLGLEVLGSLMAASTPEAIVLPIDWDRFARARRRAAADPFFSVVVVPRAGHTQAARKAIVPSEDGSELERALCAIISEVLQVESVRLEDEFVALGGDSVSALQVTGKVRKAGYALSIRDLFEGTVGGIARRLSANAEDAPDEHALVHDEEHRFDPFPLNEVQQAYWFGRRRELELGGVSTHGYLELDFDTLDLDRLEAALGELIQAHDMLRAIIHEDGTQRVLSHVPPYEIAFNDLSEEPPEVVDSILGLIRDDMSHQVLPATSWPVFDFRVTRTPAGDRLHVSVDNLILDAASILMLFAEWSRRYAGQTVGAPPQISFRDYLLAVERLRNSDAHARGRAYWAHRLSSLPFGPTLPLATAPSSIETPRFVRKTRALSADVWASVKAKASALRLTPTAVLLAVYAEVLGRWSGSDAFLINVSVFSRLPLHPDVDKVLGDFTTIELLEVGTKFWSRAEFRHRCEVIQSQLLADLEHNIYTGIDVMRDLSAHHRRPLGNLAPVVLTSMLSDRVLDRASLVPFTGFKGQAFGITQTPQVWLDNKAYENEDGGLIAEWDFVDGLFPSSLIDEMHEAYCRTIEYLANAEWSAQIPDLAGVRRLEVTQSHAESQPVPTDRLEGAVWDQIGSRPADAVAIMLPAGAVTYRQLADESAALAQMLSAEEPVAVLMRKGWQQVAATVGILSSGAAYLPIHADWPEERIAGILDQAGTRTIVTTSDVVTELNRSSALRSRRVIELPPIPVSPSAAKPAPRGGIDDIAYVIFTSGSTGVPKGVVVKHRAARNTIVDINRRFAITNEDRVLGLSSLTFDLSVWDIFGVLAAGGGLVLPNEARIRDPNHWLELMAEHRVSVWNSVPMFMHMLVAYAKEARPASLEAASRSLRLVMLSGDWIPLELPDQIRELFPSAAIVSLGGATEAAIWSILYPIDRVDPAWRSIPYGKAMQNQSVTVRNARIELCPIHTPGEICIGGVGLAEGYWGDAEKTAAHFVRDPASGEKIYKTGDMGRLLPSGDVEILGRKDLQVKVRGHRIELGEIEHALEALPGVARAVADVSGPRENRSLVAYVVPDGMSPDEQLRFKLDRRDVVPRGLGVARRLPAPADMEARIGRFFARSSYRRFDTTRIDLADLEACLASPARGSERRAGARTFALGDVLAELSAYERSDLAVPKRRYPSAGGLYPVRVYVEVHGMTGLEDGHYFYHPNDHALVRVGGAQTATGPRVAVHLVAHMPAIEPVYGRLARPFSAIEAGHIEAALIEGAARSGGALVGFPPSADLTRKLELEEHDWLISSHRFEDDAGTEAPDAVDVYAWVRPGEIYRLHDGKLVRIESWRPRGLPFGLIGDNARIVEQAGALVLFVGQPEAAAWTEAGRKAQRLMEAATLRDLGTCAIGVAKADRSLHDLIAGQPVYSVALGAIHRDRIAARVVEATEHMPPEEALRSALRQILPEYMVPSELIGVRELPLTANGKVDRGALPKATAPRSQPSSRAPRNQLERALVEIWQEVLEVPEVRVGDSYLDLGGTSLHLARCLARLGKMLGEEVSAVLLFEHVTVAALAERLAQDFPVARRLAESE